MWGKSIWILALAMAAGLAACDKDVGNPAPPRIETPLNLPKPASTIIVPLTIDIADIEARLNQTTPSRLWAINQYEPKCVPAQRVTVCAVHTRKCKGDAAKMCPARSASSAPRSRRTWLAGSWVR